MQTKDITIGDRKFQIKELRGVDVDDIDWNDKKNAIKKQIQLSTGLTDLDYENLTLKERLFLLQEINEINGLSDFQTAQNGKQ